MPYRLHDDLSFCQVGDHLVFLDARNDRYFRLSSTMERAFLAYLEGDNHPGISAAYLIQRNILTAATRATRREHLVSISHPARSALERASRLKRIDIPVLIDVFTIVCSTRLQLASRNLDRILTALANYRRSRTLPSPTVLSERDTERLVDTVAMFWRARAYVPVKPRCLLDSLAIVRFLAKRGLHANLVFGVTDNPFAAHAWAQAGDLVLSDTVGNATAHTTIRIV